MTRVTTAEPRDTAPYPYLLIEGDGLDAGPRHPNATRGALLARAVWRTALS